MPEIELERYELFEQPAYRFELERRDFFKFLGGGLVLLLALDGRTDAQESGRGAALRPDARPPELAAWLHIGEDGAVTVYTGKTEVGQNIRTSLAQAVAEELRSLVGTVRLVMADTDLTPYDMGTFGSRTTPLMAPQMKKVGAAAREALIDLAAEQWKADRSAISVGDGKVTNKTSGSSVGFGELTRGQKLVKMVDGASVTPPPEWKLEGTSAPKVNARDIVTGAHRFTSDVTRPNILMGRVLRPPAFRAKLTSFDAKPAGDIPDVQVVRDGDFVGAVAPDEETLGKAIFAIKTAWSSPPQPSNKELFEVLRKGAPAAPDANLDQALQAADHKLDATYTVEYIAHVPLEPRAAVAEWQGDRLTVWTGTQRPWGVQSDLAEAFQIPADRIRVIVPDTGSAYGGKHTGEAAVEAARLAKAANKPVKLIWSREEEFTWAYFRPAGVIDIRSGVNSDGLIGAWDFHNYNSGPSAMDTPYAIEKHRAQFHPADSPLRQGSYRGLAATANHFARESHMDDLAATVGMDSLEFRLKNLKNERLRAVLEAATTKFGWRKAKNTGLACGVEKGGYVATCAEISITPAEFAGSEVTPAPPRVKIDRVVTAFECGAVVNPEHLKNQIEGSVMMAIGGALFESVQFADGRILNPHLAKYRVPRFSDMPVIETVLVDRKDLPSAGAGETPIVGLAPAVGNAIFRLTGTRIRSLPMVPGGFVKPA
ncbi:MAG TPA: molybdopterin cofactor-binding domain-containing protein [Bryobacteraceae bacterium]|nr:molybdopterin cofactor-binding domain-containing protein [Bryobacteraceae bacterium]